MHHQEELKEWDQCMLMLGEAKVDENGNVYDTKDGNVMYLDKDGEDREINVSLFISLLHFSKFLQVHLFITTFFSLVFKIQSYNRPN